jgi:hypothetical protein
LNVSFPPEAGRPVDAGLLDQDPDPRRTSLGLRTGEISSAVRSAFSVSSASSAFQSTKRSPRNSSESVVIPQRERKKRRKRGRTRVDLDEVVPQFFLDSLQTLVSFSLGLLVHFPPVDLFGCGARGPRRGEEIGIVPLEVQTEQMLRSHLQFLRWGRGREEKERERGMVSEGVVKFGVAIVIDAGNQSG